MDLRLRLLEVLEPRLAEDFVELVDVEILVSGRRRTVRLLVDQPGGINVDDCARISRHVGDLLDSEDLIPFRYVLEVSSPGLNRPLRKPEHFERFAGEQVQVRMHDDFGPRRRFTGCLLGLEDGDVCLRSDGGEDVRLPLDKLRSARTQIDPWRKKVSGDEL
jgi:ribosome maturation factor RimP